MMFWGKKKISTEKLVEREAFSYALSGLFLLTS